MRKLKVLLTVVMALGLTLGLTSMAAAKAITCGGCHSMPPADADNCNNNAKQVHNVHMNYSSATYKKNTDGTKGNCSYCHPTQSGSKSSDSVAANRTHNNNFINVTGNSMPLNSRQNSALTFASLAYNTGTKQCSNSCHSNRGETANWINFTTVTPTSVKLSCRACHDDSTDKWSGKGSAHNAHLLSNCTTPGAYGLMSAGSNAGCKNCHPDNTGDWFKNGKKDDGTQRAYPHAEGTIWTVNDDTAAIAANLSSKSGSGANTTCTNTCHRNNTAPTWGTTDIQCDACHYWAASPTVAGNNGATVGLSTGHNAHFRSNLACTNCHPNRGTGLVTDYNNNKHARYLPSSGLLKGAYAVMPGTVNFTYNSGAKTCTNTGWTCHGNSATPAWTSTGNGCKTCHAYPGTTRLWTGGLENYSSNNGHNVMHDMTKMNSHIGNQANLYNYTAVNSTDKDTVVMADTNRCGLCHYKVAHKNGTGYANLSTSVTAGWGKCGGKFTITVTKQGRTGGSPNGNVTCGSVKCHSGKTTPNWW